MNSREMFRVAVSLMGVWFVSVAVVSILAGAIGPFAHLIIGCVLLVIGNSIAERTSAE